MSDLSIEPCRRDDEGDARQILEWRNDPGTLSMSFHREPKVWPSFFDEYRRDYFVDATLAPFFVIEDGRRVAFIRYRRIDAKTSDVSINVAPSIRGRNLGTRAIILAASEAHGRGIVDIVAEIRGENLASIRAFEKAGFIFSERTFKDIDTGERAEIVIYRRHFE